jgi:phage tail sheath protein FI
LYFELQDCVAWLQGLRQGLGLPRAGFNYDDARPIADLSYAAVYHPWLLVPDPAGAKGNLRPVPPDGAACGAIAARELDRGVWIAPANDALPGVLDLQPEFSDDDWAILFAAGFNLARAEPRDFRFMSAHTLADDRQLLQLSVRRLMIQLRKAAAEQGRDYVFARNDDLLRRRLQVRLEALLDTMFIGGAFAGATRNAAYRITIDDTVNRPADADQGRVVAQILVAPSQPMEFLTVLLTRDGDGQLQSAEG